MNLQTLCGYIGVYFLGWYIATVIAGFVHKRYKYTETEAIGALFCAAIWPVSIVVIPLAFVIYKAEQWGKQLAEEAKQEKENGE